ncbi:hypothetical protein AVEN_109744-1 [Araneus ventricosus]|uniref:Uncharacterized protein n=1 Tax=Araneus ventricosus TaxID=182803 RepID=A0A4Y2JB81_ARAVE|nr:hypothetical protein AVEN_109744-1 [Araneus ventricosus]
MERIIGLPAVLISEAISESHLPSKEANRLRPAFVHVKATFLDHLARYPPDDFHNTGVVEGSEFSLECLMVRDIDEKLEKLFAMMAKMECGNANKK